MATELTINPRIAQWIVQSVGRLLAIFAILQGLNIIFGGKDRWGSEAFLIALMLPGAPSSWGFILSAFGLIAFVGSIRGKMRPVVVGMIGSSVWCVFFTICFIVAVIDSSHAASTGVFAYATFSALYAMLAVAYRSSRLVTRTGGTRAVHGNHS